MSFYTEDELVALGFKQLGKNVLLSKKASIYNPSKISIGNNTRIDDFVVISAGVGGVDIGSNVHIAVYTSLIGTGKIYLSDFSNISSRVSIYSSNDDYSGLTMTNPTIPSAFKNVVSESVFIGRHVIVGSGSIILPGLKLDEGVAVGALSLITKSCEKWSIYAGNPAKKIKERYKDLLKLEIDYKEQFLDA